MLYVLTTKLEGKQGYGPVAVVDDEHVANEWIRAGVNNDWVPLELNDLSTTGLAAGPGTFKPQTPQKRQQQTTESVEKARQNLEEANRLLQEALKRKQRIKSHAKRAGRRDEIKKHYEAQAQTVLNDYLMTCGEDEQDPEIYDFLDYLKMEYRANVPEEEYTALVDSAYALYKQTFGSR